MKISVKGVGISALILASSLGIASSSKITGLHSVNLKPDPEVVQNQRADKAQVISLYGRLPMTFEVNQGQSDPQVKFLSRGSGYNLFLTSTEAVLALSRWVDSAIDIGPQEGKKPPREKVAQAELSKEVKTTVVRMQLLGANPKAQVVGVDEQSGKSHYFAGSNTEKWVTNVSQYAKVKYEQVYPGIDLVFYGNQMQLEYDFAVAPGADPKAIRLAFKGADKLEVNQEGHLIVHIGGGKIVQHAPVIYQEFNKERKTIAGRYRMEGKNRVGFQVAVYDKRKELIIDPVLVYSTYLGGSGVDWARGIAVDGSGNAYVTGYTESGNFPRANAGQPTFGGNADVFVTKLTSDGSALIYSTYLGGNGWDYGWAIAVDSTGNAYVTGRTSGGTFPIVNAFQPIQGGSDDAFVTKLDTSGGLVYSSYLGGRLDDEGRGIDADGSGNTYITGFTYSDNFPVANAVQPNFGGGTCYGGYPCSDAFVAKVTSNGSALAYSTYLGGSGQDEGWGVSVDSSGNFYVAGGTLSGDFPIINAFQTMYGGGTFDGDAFVTKLDATGAFVYSTYLGGSGEDKAHSLDIDSAGNSYVTGRTTSIDFPTVDACQAILGGGYDAFVTKLDSSGALSYSTYLGGSSFDSAQGLALDGAGNFYLAGNTLSDNFPVFNAVQPRLGGGAGDVFVSKFNISGRLNYSTYLGGFDIDEGHSLDVDSTGNTYITGYTRSSSNFPIVNAFQPAYGGSVADAFIAKLSPISAPSCPTLSTAPWTSRFNGSANSHDVAQSVVTDADCNIYVTGWSHNGSNFDYLTAKYDPSGNLLWTARYDNGAGDFGHAVRVDETGNVYVTGRSHTSLANQTFDIATIKYDADGNLMWVRRYDHGRGMDDIGLALAVDGNGNSYVTGLGHNGLNTDLIMIKYNTVGDQISVYTYDNGGNDSGRDVKVDACQNAYVTGWSEGGGFRDYVTIKVGQWVARYNGSANNQDVAQSVAMDGSGNVVVTGWSHNGVNFDSLTVKYDGSGNQLWARAYDNGAGDFGHVVRVDGAGNVVVTGRSHTSLSNLTFDVATVKYDSSGNQLWVRRYDRAGLDDMGLAMVLDASGNAIVTGFGNNGTNIDYLTIKHDVSGNILWVNIYDNGSDDTGRGIVVDSAGNVYVTGWSNGVGGLRDYATIKYAP